MYNLTLCVDVPWMFKEIGDDHVIDDIIKSKCRSVFWTAVTLLIFKLERRTNTQNVGNWTGYLDVILISKSSQSLQLSSLWKFWHYAISDCFFIITCQNGNFGKYVGWSCLSVS